MARYVGDLTDPKRNEAREMAAQRMEEVTRAIRDRRIKSVSVSWDREVTRHGFGVPPETGDWEVGVEIGVTGKGRHEE